MRRRSLDVQGVDALFGPELDRASRLDPEVVIATLEPLVTPERRARLASVIGERLDSVTVLMDAPHDPHNGAAVVRTCDAMGVQRLHVVERLEPFLVATTIAKGSQKWVEVLRHEDSADALAALARSGHELVATSADGDLLPADLANIPRLALVVGNERGGIAAGLRAKCIRAVRVPMRGFAESLNLSVSTAILLSRAVEGRKGDLSEADRRRLYARGLFLTVPKAATLLVER